MTTIAVAGTVAVAITVAVTAIVAIGFTVGLPCSISKVDAAGNVAFVSNLRVT